MTIQIPPELFAEWLAEARKLYVEPALIAGFVAEKAAEWAADQELEACCEWVEREIGHGREWNAELRAARRPKPPSLKQQALHALLHMDQGQHNERALIIRRALESIPDADS